MVSVVPGPRQRIELRRLLASVSVRNDGISVEQVQGQQGLFASELHNIVLQTRFLHAEHAARNSKLGGPCLKRADSTIRRKDGGILSYEKKNEAHALPSRGGKCQRSANEGIRYIL